MFNAKTRTVVVVGAQWGDEGKGKLVDVIAEGADWVVRYQGGANAGHTVHIGDRSFVGALVAEYTRGGDAKLSTRAATGALVGRAAAAAVKTGLGCVIAAWLFLAAWS